MSRGASRRAERPARRLTPYAAALAIPAWGAGVALPEPRAWAASGVALAVTLSAAYAADRRAQAERQRAREALRHGAEQAQAAADERDGLARQLQHWSEHDRLTQLPDRTALARMVAAAQSESEPPSAVLWMNLHGFRSVNESLGHAAGDALLVAVADRLRATLRPVDAPTRVGSDTFAVLMRGFTDEQAQAGAAQLIDILAAPYEVAGGSVHVGIRAGLAPFTPGDGQSAEEVLRRADMALRDAKAKHRTLARYDAGSAQNSMQRAAIEADLRRAVERSEFFLCYQPLVDLDTGRIAAVEALIRWAHPERGVVSPGEFIPVAEDTGLVVPMGLWALKEACRQQQAWRHGHGADLLVAVNLSARQLQEPEIVESVREVLWRSSVDPRQIVLEVTESLLVDDTDSAVRTLWELRGLGVRLAMDDFGTGYSSLSRLGEMPIDEMKIDRSFVTPIGGPGNGETILTAAIAMGHGLGLAVVAEGVETEEQLAFLRHAGCDLIQGFLLGKPVIADELTPMLHRELTTPNALAGVPAQRAADREATLPVPGVLPSLAPPDTPRFLPGLPPRKL